MITCSGGYVQNYQVQVLAGFLIGMSSRMMEGDTILFSLFLKAEAFLSSRVFP